MGGGLDGGDGLGADAGFAGRDLRCDLTCHVCGLFGAHDDGGSEGGAAGDLSDYRLRCQRFAARSVWARGGLDLGVVVGEGHEHVGRPNVGYARLWRDHGRCGY